MIVPHGYMATVVGAYFIYTGTLVAQIAGFAFCIGGLMMIMAGVKK